MITKIPGFACTFENKWHQIGLVPSVSLSKDPFIPRPWQKEFAIGFEESDHKNFILNASTGSGKTKAVMYSVSSIVGYSNQKIIISVPQKNIGSGFTDIINFILPNGEPFDYRVEKNLCQKNMTENSKTKALIDFLEDNSSMRFVDRIIVCCHQTLVKVFSKIKKEDKLSLLDNTFLCIDESHHIIHSEDEDDEEAITNQLGRVSKYYLDNPDKVFSIGYITATLFRGDRASIIPQQYLDTFYRYNLSYDRHFEENCGGLKFIYNFLLHDKSWLDAIEQLFSERIAKTLIFIPHPISRFATGMGKDEEVKKIIQIIANNNSVEITEDSNGIINVQRDKKNIRIIDIVAEENREKKIEYLRKNPNDIDVVIGMNVPKEGFDWDAANRGIIIGVKNSQTEQQQMLGRFFRYHPDKVEGKTPVEVIQVLPWIKKEDLDENDFRDQLNNFMKVIYASLVSESIYNPVKIEVSITKEDGSEEKEERDSNYLLDYLRDKIDGSKYFSLWEDIFNELLSCRYNNPDKEDLESEYKNIVLEQLGKHNVDDHQDELASLFLNNFKRKTDFINEYNKSFKKATSGIDVSEIDCDLVSKIDPYLGFIIGYSNGICGASNLRDFRQLLNRYCWLPFEEARDFSRSLMFKTNTEWINYCHSTNKPDNIPQNPHVVYKEFKNYTDWLGIDRIDSSERIYLSFTEARKIVRNSNIKNTNYWPEYCRLKKPENIPSHPSIIYNKEWKGWKDFLGYNEFISFEEAKIFVSSLGLKTYKEWSKYCTGGNKPDNIPQNAHGVYEDQWKGYGDFLGTGNISPKYNKYRSFKEAREFIRKIKLSSSQWREYCKSGKKPKDIPGHPHLVYKDEFIDWGDWLGTGNISGKKRHESFLSFEKTKERTGELEFQNQIQYKNYCKIHKELSANPNRAYKDQWKGWGDFLGNGNTLKGNFVSFEEAKKYIVPLQIQSYKKWIEYCRSGRKPKNIPNAPHIVYKLEWKGYEDFFNKC